MDMTNRVDTITALTVSPEGQVADVELETGQFLRGCYAAIDCDTVDVVGLTSTLDMWVDDEGLINGSESNAFATAVAQAFGFIYQPYAGTVLFAEHNDEGDTVSLRPELRAAVRQLLGL